KRRRRIDRSMIGEPTNFVHTTHVGSGDMGLGMPAKWKTHKLLQRSVNIVLQLSFDGMPYKFT
ncbi:hypothetical protein Z043_109417, partial [Scleropages formosus]